MEKRKPHSNITKVKSLVEQGKVCMTLSAISGAAALGLNTEEMIEIVMSLTSKDFYKSMTTHIDHTMWQDVYHPSTKVGDIYLKLMVSDNVLIISFKER
jgi:motility quorum-sensing regulator/GCU-specific mRNA interferase toxin